MKKLLMIMCLFLAACTVEPKEHSGTDNPGFTVDLLFEHEGCKVYRFYDDGHHIYYTNCPGQTQHQVGCGKNCSRPEVTPTGNP